MARNGYRIVDSDMHLIEPPDLWQRYIDPAYADQAPRGLTEYPRDLALEVNGTRFPRHSALSKKMLHQTRAQQADRYTHAEARGYDAVSQLEALDREGIDIAVLFPSRGLFALAFETMDPGLSAAIARAYNDWLGDFCSAEPSRLLGSGMVSPHNVEAAADEARRVVQDYGFTSVFMRPNPVCGRYWHHPDYDPLWATLVDLDIPIGFHEGGSGELDTIEQTGSRFDKGIMGHVASHPMEMMQACISMCMGGVLERFPTLRVALLEGNCAWVPWLLWRMDEHIEWRGAVEAPELSLMPSEYFKRNCYVSIECDELPGVQAVEALDGDCVVFSTDYPHGDSKYPHATEAMMKLPLSDAHRRKVLWDNCAALYKLEE